MAFSFKNAAHAIATFLKAAKADVVKFTPAIVAEITKIEGTKTVVEAETAAIGAVVAPAYAPLAVSVEDAGYAVLGELVSLLNAGNAATEQNLLNAGLDQNVINTVKAVASGATQIITLVNAVQK